MVLYLGLSRNIDEVALLGAAIAGASLGFLPWNVPKARVFLGDAGSYGLGLALGSTALIAWADGVWLLAALAPLLIYIQHRMGASAPDRRTALLEAGASRTCLPKID